MEKKLTKIKVEIIKRFNNMKDKYDEKTRMDFSKRVNDIFESYKG